MILYLFASRKGDELNYKETDKIIIKRIAKKNIYLV